MLTLENIILPNPVNPGASSSVDLFNDTPTGNAANTLGPLAFSRVTGSGFIDQACTIFLAVRSTPTETWRVINNAGAGDALTASVAFTFDYALIGRYNRVYITTVTAPTVFGVSVIGSKQRGRA